MSEIRLLLATLPGMLSEIIREAASCDSDVRILEEVATLEELPAAIGRTRPHVLVVGSPEGALPKECVVSMYRQPHPRTLAVSSDGRVTSAYRLRPHGVRMENLSPTGLVEAIRELSLPPPELR